MMLLIVGLASFSMLIIFILMTMLVIAARLLNDDDVMVVEHDAVDDGSADSQRFVLRLSVGTECLIYVSQARLTACGAGKFVSFAGHGGYGGHGNACQGC